MEDIKEKTDNESKYKVACGSLKTMEMIKEKGFKALNPKTHKFQIVDKEAEYEIVKDGILYFLKSNKDLIKIAEEKGLIC